MAEERTEPATARRRQDAREKGQVVRSTEIGSAFILFTGFAAMWVFGGRMLFYLESYMRWMYSPVVMVHLPLNQTNVGYLFQDMFVFTARVLAPLFIAIIIVAFFTNYFQVGLRLTFTSLQPNFAKLNPITGVTRLFSLRAFQELLKSIVKITVIGWVAYNTVKSVMALYVAAADMSIAAALAMLGQHVVTLAIKVAIIMIVLGIIDYIYQKYEFEKSIRMTKQEIKDEYKQREGDPMVRSRIRQKQREIAMKRMMKEVPKADVVITNPTRLAIALQYVSEEMHAPKVVAKGAGVVAEKIREVAKEANVPIVEDRWLAQSLFKLTDVGEYVPASLFKAVAEVLAYVYRMGARKNRFGI